MKCRLVLRRVFLLLCILITTHIPAPSRCEPDAYTRVQDRLESFLQNKAVTVTRIGNSIKGRLIYAVTITADNNLQTPLSQKTRVLVLSGQHGDEPEPVYSALDLINILVHDHLDVLKDIELVIVPVVNPDGFAATKRHNSANIDLNRNWNNPDQPETLAVTRLIKQFRPHVIIDLHAWIEGELYSPDCIETAGFGHKSEIRLARMLATSVTSRLKEAKIHLIPTHYRKESDLTMAHRHFTSLGICCFLIETSPNWPIETRRKTYIDCINNILNMLAFPPSKIMSNDLAMIKNKHPENQSWISSLNDNYQNKDKAFESVYLLIIVSAITMIAVISATSRKNSQKILRVTGVRPLSFTEVVRCDLPVHTRLALIHQHRARPSDRSSTRKQAVA